MKSFFACLQTTTSFFVRILHLFDFKRVMHFFNLLCPQCDSKFRLDWRAYLCRAWLFGAITPSVAAPVQHKQSEVWFANVRTHANFVWGLSAILLSQDNLITMLTQCRLCARAFSGADNIELYLVCGRAKCSWLNLCRVAVRRVCK